MQGICKYKLTMQTKTAKLEAFVAVPELKFEFSLQFVTILSKGRSSGQGRSHRGLLQRWKTSLQSTVTSLLTSATNKKYTYYILKGFFDTTNKAPEMTAIFLTLNYVHMVAMQ